MTEQTKSDRPLGPYEPVLIKAFDKLTSQILIFLLAYMILLIGLTVFGRGIPQEIRDLLYVIPVLGILGYSLAEKRRESQNAAKRGINVGVLFASDSAYVAGVRGPTNMESEDVVVNVGKAGGNAQIVGRDVATGAMPMNSNEFWAVYQKLEPQYQKEVGAQVMELFAKQLRTKN